MSWLGKMMGGAIGFALGGPLGAVTGAAMGHFFIDSRETLPFTNTEKNEAAYFIAFFSMLAKVAKADGIVKQDEIRAVEQCIAALNLNKQTGDFAKSIFAEAKNSSSTIDEFARQYYGFAKGKPQLLRSMLEMLLHVSFSDTHFHPEEERMILTVKNIFHVSDYAYELIKKSFIQTPAVDPLEKQYAVLNCTAGSTNDEIKQSYRKLVRDFHPDTLASKGLPHEFTQFATNKLQEINAAYEAVKNARGIS